jgi:hypothetical protein
MRSRIPRELIEQHFGRALVLAMSLTESPEAAALPGWRRHPELTIGRRFVYPDKQERPAKGNLVSLLSAS